MTKPTEHILLRATDGERIDLEAHGNLPAMAHVFEDDSILAVNTAHAAGRPLLVRGEPGTGKSQLARAVAKKLGWAIVSKVLDAHTEVRELFWSFDAVARLAEAQLMAALGDKSNEADVRKRLAEARFLRPGPLWWAFDWAGAKRHCVDYLSQDANAKQRDPEPTQPDKGDPKRGCVVLLDEIDKTDASVPNGLLEALGGGCFDTPCAGKVAMAARVDPLVIITTNEERELPDAFLRRCVVLQLALPRRRDELIPWLIERGVAHHDRAISQDVLTRAAEQLADDRATVQKKGLSAPGQAEYLDLLRTLHRMAPGNEQRQLNLLARASRFILQKHPAETRA